MVPAPHRTKVAIITGGGRGLGRAMALGLVHAGIRVVLTAAHRSDELERVAAEIQAEAGEHYVATVQADVSREEHCEAVVAFALSRFGRLDILINNAARGMRFVSEDFLTNPTPFWEVTPEIWETLIATNVNGPFWMARAVTPHFLSAGWGRIVNITINRQTINRKGFSPYGLSKAAVEAETAIWAEDLNGTGVTVNALLPGGATLTGMIPESQPEHIRASLLKPDIIVPPLLWLVSDASNDVTGKRIVATEWNNGDHQFEGAGF